MTTLLILCGVFIAINGLFVAAEFAVVGAPKTAIEHRAGTGDRLAKRLLHVLETPSEQDRYIATSQLGITVASLGLGMYGEPLVAAAIQPHVGPIPFVGAAALAGALGLAILTLVHLVFGEIVPKSLVLTHAELIARLAYWPIRATFFVLYPLVRGLSGVARLCLRALGVRRRENAHDHYTPEELQLIVKESEASGAIRAESGRLLHELFEFGGLTAGEAMMPRVRVIGMPAGAAPDEIRAIIAAARHTRYPVFDGDLDHIQGVVHVKDLLRRLVANQPMTAADLAPMPVVPETAALDDVLTTMQRASAHVAVVVDEHGGTAGLISLEDLFEEVVGDIDEGAVGPAGLVPFADGSVRAPGTLRVDELGQHFNLALEHEQVDSVSGLVLAVLGRPPLVGEVVEYQRLRIEVLSLSGLGVREVRAWLVDAPADA
jgi:CBS domain containing-hemolysin-like protein